MTPALTRMLTLEAPSRTPDGAGGFTETWAALGTLWAEVTPGTGREAELSELPVATVPLKITVRAAPHGAPSRPAPGQRLRDGARIFRILAVTEAEPRARFLTCFARQEEVRA
jgi:head-tail adaptor